MTYHPVVDKILALLRDAHVWFETFEHEPVRTSEEAANLRDGYTLHQGAKALIVQLKLPDHVKKFVMVVLPGDVRFDKTKVKNVFGAKDVRFATEAEVLQLTGGVLPGGVPPFGTLFGLEVVVDPSLLANQKIIFNAGDRSFSIGMNSVDYLRVLQPKVAEIV